MAHLIVRPPGRAAFRVALAGALRIGRHAGCELALDDAKVSREHCSLMPAEGGWRVVDHASRHGVLLGGRPVTEAVLADGDALQIGEVIVTFCAADEPTSIAELGATVLEPPTGESAEARRLRLFYRLGRALETQGDTAALLDDLLGGVLDALGCERVLLELSAKAPGGARRALRVRAGAGGDVVLARAHLEALAARRTVLVREDLPGTLRAQAVRSALGVPLVLGEQVVGLLYADDRGAADRFARADLELLSALGQLVAQALAGADRYQRAVQQAEALQESGLELVGDSAAMGALRAELARYARADAAVLVHGETGSGKELVARTLHAQSARAEAPFVAINCAAMPDTMIESELFGHDKGAFTGAIKDKRGKLALAHRGTCFLDEIGDLSAAAQAKVLRAVEAGEVQPLGSERTVHIDVRFVAASHKDLRAEIAAGRFREDLYYRLAVIEVEVPPLRSRGDDVALLGRRFLAESGARAGRRDLLLSDEASERLSAYRWPGNVRELRNEMERVAIRCDGPVVAPEDLSPRVRGAVPVSAAPAAQGASTAAAASLADRFARLEPSERELVEQAMRAAGGNVSEAARLLGISRIMMRRRLERFGLRGDDPAGD